MLRSAALAVALAAGLGLVACDKKAEPAPSAPPAPPAAAKPLDVGSLGVSKPAPERVVAIGDIHGDLEAARRALRLAGAIDAKDAWIGGKLVVVQTGDQIDRGDDDKKILDLFEKLKEEAPKTGGEVISLVGNHEIMNAQLDFRYVTDGAYREFSTTTPKDDAMMVSAIKVAANARGRAFAFLPRGPYAELLAKRPAVARVGDSIFVHGGVLPKHVKAGLDSLNAASKAWLLGEKSELPKEIIGEDGLLWTRMFSAAPSKEDCAKLDETLTLLKAKRLVMGHTVQKPDISPACDDKAWRIDIGLSKFYGGPTQVLELKGDTVTVLKGS